MLMKVWRVYLLLLRLLLLNHSRHFQYPQMILRRRHGYLCSTKGHPEDMKGSCGVMKCYKVIKKGHDNVQRKKQDLLEQELCSG